MEIPFSSLNLSSFLGNIIFKRKGQFSFIFTDTICHYVVVLMNYFI